MPVETLWLSLFVESPQADFGSDVSDVVLNHTSDPRARMTGRA